MQIERCTVDIRTFRYLPDRDLVDWFLIDQAGDAGSQIASGPFDPSVQRFFIHYITPDFKFVSFIFLYFNTEYAPFKIQRDKKCSFQYRITIKIYLTAIFYKNITKDTIASYVADYRRLLF